jgi:hypothetical protein
MGVVGVLIGVYLFREILEPGQQQRVINYLPFMESLLDRPDVGSTLPTAQAVDEDAANALLNSPLSLASPTDDNAGAVSTEVTEDATPEAETTDEAALIIAAEPTQAPSATPIPTLTTPPPTATLPPTSAPPVTQNVNTVSAQVDFSPSTSVGWAPAAQNFGFRYQKQTWNNCGPANITMALSYYGWTRDQAFAGDILKPNREDKNVSPHELAEFVNERSDIKGLWRMGGSLNILRALIANEFPVIIERGHMFEGYDWLGHYQTLVGYNDNQRTFVIYDSFLGEGIFESYDAVDQGWRDFNRAFVVVYDPAREARLMEILGDLAEPDLAATSAFNTAQEEARLNPQDAFAWFNMGTSLTALERYQEAAYAFDRATSIGLPWRMLWYQFGPLEAYFNEGRYDDVLKYVDNNLNNGGEYVEETYYWQGRVFAAQGRTGEAATAFRNALRHNSHYTAAQEALNALDA